MLKNKKIGIYAILNKLNNKVYIGQSRSITQRWKVHKNLLKNNTHYNRHLQSACNNDGIENFKFMILELCENDVIDKREAYWINFFKSNTSEFGYNKDSGGSKHKKMSNESRRKLSEYAKKRGMPREVIEKAREVNKTRRGKLHPMFGKKHSLESLQKMSKSKTGVSNGPHSEETKRKISIAHTGKKMGPMSEERRRQQSVNSTIRIPISADMKNDVVNGMSRRKFEKKYGISSSPWNRIKKAINAGTLDELL